MPIFVKFPEQNKFYGKPIGWVDEDCSTLPVWQGHYKLPNGALAPRIISCWEFTEEEWELLSKTRRVYLNICSTGLAPMSLQVDNPFETEKDSLF